MLFAHLGEKEEEAEKLLLGLVCSKVGWKERESWTGKNTVVVIEVVYWVS